MSKLSPFLAAAALASLASCIYPAPPPPHFRPRPYPPERLDPEAQPYGMPPAREPDPTPQPSPTPPGVGGYPTATRTANPNQVLSPYEPYNVIDVEGFKSGQLARDPSNQKIFRIP